MARHPNQLSRDCYVGYHAHFLTAATYRRRRAFVDRPLCEAAADQLLRACAKHGFSNIAYTFMPDHVHVLVEGERSDADFLKWRDYFRQLSGYWERGRSGLYLWQEGCWDYTLRGDEALLSIASYIVWNPVRAGLVALPEEYPYAGSSICPVKEIGAYAPARPRYGA